MDGPKLCSIDTSGYVRIFNRWVRDATSDHLRLNKILLSKCMCCAFFTAAHKLMGSAEPIKPKLTPPLNTYRQKALVSLIS